MWRCRAVKPQSREELLSSEELQKNVESSEAAET